MTSDQKIMWQTLSSESGDWVPSLLGEIRDALSRGVVEVIFCKANGELRTMKCTLNEQLGAKYSHDESKTPKTTNPNVCAVWDTELQAWRSFRWDRLKRAKFPVG